MSITVSHNISPVASHLKRVKTTGFIDNGSPNKPICTLKKPTTKLAVTPKRKT